MNCPECKAKLETKPWNKLTDISFCNTPSCPRFRQPANPLMDIIKRERRKAVESFNYTRH